MSLPVRCFSCGYVIGKLEQKFIDLLEKGESYESALKTLNVELYCCRRILLGYVNIAEKLLLFPQQIETNDKKNSEAGEE
uniref:DNA-directed RNA polymerase n=1 Tax=viral metagenome TaxID=1070528 RepID=A0A6C0EQE2_9ZZZZ